MEAEARARDRRPPHEAEPECWQAEAPAYLGPHALDAPDPWPAAGAAIEVMANEEQDWPRDLDALRRLLGDDELARRVEQPLPTDVECEVTPAIWHLMAVLESRRRGDNPHPMAVRAAIVRGCGYSLTGEAVAGVLAAARVSDEPAERD